MVKPFAIFIMAIILMTFFNIYPNPYVGTASSYGANGYVWIDKNKNQLNDGGDYNTTTIQDAINNASNYDWIMVESGTYNENIVVNKTGLLIKSTSGPNITIINVSNSKPVFVVKNDNVIIQGFTITRNTEGWGIDIDHVKNCTIKGNIVYNNLTYGIIALKSSNCTIINNILYNVSTAIYFDVTEYSKVYGNNVYKSGVGIYIQHSPYNTVYNNTVYDNRGGIYVWDYSSNTTIYQNYIYNNTRGLLVGAYADNSIVKKNYIYNNIEYGIKAQTSGHIIITENSLYSNKYGIYIDRLFSSYYLPSLCSLISKNNIYENEYGIYIYSQKSPLLIHYNKIYNNTLYGAYCDPNCEIDVDASLNWWGSPTGPYNNITNPSGLGDNISQHILYSPWLKAKFLSGSSFPREGINVVLIVSDPDNLTPEEFAVEEIVWGFIPVQHFSVISHQEAATFNFTPYDVAIVTWDPSWKTVPKNYSNLINSGIGIVFMSADVAKIDLGNSSGVFLNGTQIIITNNTHYITSPFNIGNLTVYSEPSYIRYINASANSTVLAVAPGGLGDVVVVKGNKIYYGLNCSEELKLLINKYRKSSSSIISTSPSIIPINETIIGRAIEYAAIASYRNHMSSALNVTITTYGSGVRPEITIVRYARNPAKVFTGDIGKYYDIFVEKLSGWWNLDHLSSIELRFYYTSDEILGAEESSLKAIWWNGTAWILCSNQSLHTISDIEGYSGYISTVITRETIPSLDDLNGTIFAITGIPSSSGEVTEKYFNLTIKVIDSNNSPVSNVTIKLFNYYNECRFVAEETTNESGIATFKNILNGTYEAIALLNNTYGLGDIHIDIHNNTSVILKTDCLQTVIFKFYTLDRYTLYLYNQRLNTTFILTLNNSSITRTLIGSNGSISLRLLRYFWIYNVSNNVYLGKDIEYPIYGIKIYIESAYNEVPVPLKYQQLILNYYIPSKYFSPIINVVANKTKYQPWENITEEKTFQWKNNTTYVYGNCTVNETVNLSNVTIICTQVSVVENNRLVLNNSTVLLESASSGSENVLLKGVYYIYNSRILTYGELKEVSMDGSFYTYDSRIDKLPNKNSGSNMYIKLRGVMSVINTSVNALIKGGYVNAYKSFITGYSGGHIILTNSIIKYLEAYSPSGGGVFRLNETNASVIHIIGAGGSEDIIINGLKPGFQKYWDVSKYISQISFTMILNNTLVDGWRITWIWNRNLVTITNSSLLSIRLGGLGGEYVSSAYINNVNVTTGVSGDVKHLFIYNCNLGSISFHNLQSAVIINSTVSSAGLGVQGPVVGIRGGISGETKGVITVNNSIIGYYHASGLITRAYNSSFNSVILTGWWVGINGVIYKMYANATFYNSVIKELTVEGYGVKIGVTLVDCSIDINNVQVKSSAAPGGGGIVRIIWGLNVKVVLGNNNITNALVMVARQTDNFTVAQGYTDENGLVAFKLLGAVITENETDYMGNYNLYVYYSNSLVAEESLSLNSSKNIVIDLSSIPRLIIKSYKIETNSSTYVPVRIENIMNLGAYDIKITYNSSVIRVNNVIGGDKPFDNPLFNINDTEGVVRINQFITNVTGVYGNITIAYLNITTIGNSGQVTPLNITIISLINASSGDEITPRCPVNGEIIIVPREIKFNFVLNIKKPVNLGNVVAVPLELNLNTTTNYSGVYEVEFNVSYSPGIEILNVIAGNNPFNTLSSIINTTRYLSLHFSHVNGGNWNKTICYIVIRLNSAVEKKVKFGINTTVNIRDIITNDTISSSITIYELPFIRGDANRDGKITIADAMFIAQYLAGNRPASDLGLLNVASVKHDGENGDKITIADAMFIAQYLAGLRDQNFNLK